MYTAYVNSRTFQTALVQGSNSKENKQRQWKTIATNKPSKAHDTAYVHHADKQDN